MNKTQAQELGRQTFANGQGNFPFACPEIVAAMEDAAPGEKTHVLKAFNKGWTLANLNAK